MVGFIKKFLLLFVVLFVVCAFVAGHVRVNEWESAGKAFGCFAVLFVSLLWQIMDAHDVWERSTEDGFRRPAKRTIRQKLRLIIGGKR